MDISRITKVILKNCQKFGKMTPLTVENGIFKKCQKSSISYVTRFTQPKYHIPRRKTVTMSLKQKNREKSKNAYKKRKNENFEKQKHAFFLIN